MDFYVDLPKAGYLTKLFDYIDLTQRTVQLIMLEKWLPENTSEIRCSGSEDFKWLLAGIKAQNV